MMLQRLGFSTLFVAGIDGSFLLPHPRTHWAWALAFLPKVILLCGCSGLNDDDAVLLAENSCWPTNCCTPPRVREVLHQAAAAGALGSWIGYGGCIGKWRTFQSTLDATGCFVDVPGNCQAPRGSKLFVGTVRYLKVLQATFERAPADWFVDTVHQCMVASGLLSVKRPALAASMVHFSVRCNREVQDKELPEQSLEGQLLSQGHHL